MRYSLNNTIGWLIVLTLLITPRVISGQQQHTDVCKEIHDYEREAYARLLNTKEIIAANNYNIVYHRCYWEIDPAVNYIRGAIKTFFRPTTAGFNQMEFDLDTILKIDSVKYHYSNLSFTHLAPAILKINLPAIINQNVLDSIEVFYNGAPANTGLGSFVQSQHNGTPIVWTLSEPFGARDWWPCKQNLADKIDSIDIVVKVPEGNRVASNGLLISEIVSDSDKIFHWKSRYPIATYLVAIAVTNYVHYSDIVPVQSGTLEVLNYVYPEDLATAQVQTQAIVDIIKLFDSLLIEYPFSKEKYGHAEFGFGGGMEHQTMSFVGGFGPALIGHECAHQWFGDHVTCGSWEDVWLHEGFASYFEWMITERYDKSGWLFGLPSVVKAIAADSGGSVRCDDTNSVSRIFDNRLTYTKAGFVLRMLNWKLGDQIFYQALRNYLNDPALKDGFAKTPQLQKHFETASGMDLSRFFNQWYYGQGYPSYQTHWLQDGSALTLTVTQTQSHPSVSFFDMPVPLRLEGKNHDTTIVVDHKYSGQVFHFDIGFRIQALRFDPDFKLISANNKVSGFNTLDLLNPGLLIYPNPASELLIIDQFSDGTQIKSITITDVFGQIVYNQSVPVQDGKVILRVAELSTGLYCLKIDTGKGIGLFKFIKP